MVQKFDKTFYSRVEKLFRVWDKDRDGKLSKRELALFIEQTEETWLPWNEEVNDANSPP